MHQPHKVNGWVEAVHKGLHKELLELLNDMSCYTTTQPVVTTIAMLKVFPQPYIANIPPSICLTLQSTHLFKGDRLLISSTWFLFGWTTPAKIDLKKFCSYPRQWTPESHETCICGWNTPMPLWEPWRDEIMPENDRTWSNGQPLQGWLIFLVKVAIIQFHANVRPDPFRNGQRLQ